MATVTQEREALIEWLTDAVARLPERHELGDIRDAIAAALASAPPAAPPEDAQKEMALLLNSLVLSAIAKGAQPQHDIPVEDRITDADLERYESKIMALAARQSDPPGLVALVREYQALINGYGDGEQSLQELDGRLAVVQERLLAYPLPASPQAETMPTIQVGDVVRVADSVAVIGSANAASFWGRQVLDAIYRDPLWRRPTKGGE